MCINLIQGLALGKLSGWEDGFAHLFDHLEGDFSCKEVQLKSFNCLWKPVALLPKVLMKPLSGHSGQSQKILPKHYVHLDHSAPSYCMLCINHSVACNIIVAFFPQKNPV